MRNLPVKSPQAWSGAALSASRQVWLAGLGAAVVSRDWLEKEAGQTFRTLVKEGTTIEAKAIRVIGNRLETSMTRADQLWKQARSTVQSTVKDTAGRAVTIINQALPRSLPVFEIGAKPAARARKAAAKRATKAGRKPAAAKTPRTARKRTPQS